MQGYPQGRWQDGEFDGRRQLKVAWSSAASLIASLENTSWPYDDGPNACTPRRADIKPFPGCRQRGSGSVASYDYALVDMYYTTRGPKLHATLQQYITEDISSFSKVFRINAGALYWGDGVQVSQNDSPMVQNHGLRWDISYNRLTSIPSYCLGYVGYVNSNAVTSPTLGRVFAAGTLLYKGAKIRANYSWGKLARYSVTYSFYYWPYGHNKVFRSGSSSLYEYIYSDAAATTLFSPYPATTFYF